MIRRLACLPMFAALLPAQVVGPPAYPERNILSPFRVCDDVCAPPEAVYHELRVMRQRAGAPGARLHFDDRGREICDDPAWQQARGRLERLSLDAGHLAEILRRSRNADERDLALYGMFWAGNPAHVFNLIAHIPGEPERRARELAYPRAIAYLRANLGRRWGDLSDDQKAAMNLPPPGSPAALAAGIKHAPRDEEHLYGIDLRPFFQLLDLDSPQDRAHGLWFLKECFMVRKDLAAAWLEPALPRLRQLLTSEHRAERQEALGLVAAIAPRDLPQPGPDADRERIAAWTESVLRAAFPPVRVISPGLVLLHPGAERDAMARAGRDALRGESIGDAVSGTTRKGEFYRGFRVGRIPDELQVLPLKAGAVITAVNGMPIDDGRHLLSVLENLLAPKAQVSLVVEYLFDGEPKALQIRVL